MCVCVNILHSYTFKFPYTSQGISPCASLPSPPLLSETKPPTTCGLTADRGVVLMRKSSLPSLHLRTIRSGQISHLIGFVHHVGAVLSCSQPHQEAPSPLNGMAAK